MILNGACFFFGFKRELPMRKLIYAILFSFTLLSGSNLTYADDHSQELPNVANVQVNVCKLKEGVSLKEYNDVTQDYVKWSKKNNVETF